MQTGIFDDSIVHSCSRELHCDLLERRNWMAMRTRFPEELWDERLASLVRSSDLCQNVVQVLTDLYTKHHKSDDEPHTWVSMEGVDRPMRGLLGDNARLAPAARFYAVGEPAVPMVMLPYIFHSNMTCVVLLIARCQDPVTDMNPFVLSAAAWRISSCVVPVFLPCQCFEKKL